MNPQAQSVALNAAVASSTDPTQVANWIKGVILGGSAAITYFAFAVFHVMLSSVTINDLATGLSYFAASVWFFYGIIHHVVAVQNRLL